MLPQSPTKGRRPSFTAILTVSTLIVVVICGYLMRCFHLLKGDHYYIVSPDSYFFHWQAERVLLHQNIPLELHSGLTYPLAYAAKVLGLVFGTSDTEALRWASLLLPPLLGAVSIIVLYVFVSKVYSSRAALLAAIVWAVALMPVFIQSAGYLDRDGLSVLLVMIGVVAFYLSRDWHVRIRHLEMGPVLGVAAVLVVEALLYIEWIYMGPLILLVILIAFWGVEVAVTLGRSLYGMMMKTEADVVAVAIQWLKLVPSTLWRSSWRPLAVILAFNFVAVAITPGLSTVYHHLTTLSRPALAGTHSIAELEGINLLDLLAYQVFIIPALLGMYLALRNGRRADFLFLGWFAVLFAIGLFARRVFLFAAPAICVLAGIGLAYLLEFGHVRFSRAQLSQALTYDWQLLSRYAVVAFGILLLFLSLVVSLPNAYNFASSGYVSANNDWTAGLEWLRDNTPQEAVVMSHWNVGYYILDVADRRPVVDNGLYGWDAERNHDVAVVYCTDNVSEAIAIMNKYGADYLIFSTLEYAILPNITKDGLGQSYGDGKSIPSEMRDSLYARALTGTLGSEEGLRRVYPEDPSITHPPLVILTT